MADYLEKLQTKGVDIEEFGNTHLKFDSRTGFFVMDKFLTALKINTEYYSYESICFPLTTREEKDRVTEYKIKYRSFQANKLMTGDTLLSEGPAIYRAFVFERPAKLMQQYEELRIKFPSTFIPYMLAATERYQRNKAERIAADDPRGAEEALRRAEAAKENIQKSLKIIAKKKAEREGKRSRKTRENRRGNRDRRNCT